MLLNGAYIQETQAITLNQKFNDDIAKALAESDAKEEEAEKKLTPPPAATPKPSESKNKVNKSSNATAEVEIQFDETAINAYSAVIADAAEDSVPEQPVEYTETDTEKTEQERAKRPASQV